MCLLPVKMVVDNGELDGRALPCFSLRLRGPLVEFVRIRDH